MYSDIQIKDKAKEVKRYSQSEMLGQPGANHGLITVEVMLMLEIR